MMLAVLLLPIVACSIALIDVFEIENRRFTLM
jgi:hypothetical protein